jgi:hypothetical protein
VLCPGGRLVLANIVSARPLKERTHRNIDLGGVRGGCHPARQLREGDRYRRPRGRAGAPQRLRVHQRRALEACSTYDIESVSLVARRPA